MVEHGACEELGSEANQRRAEGHRGAWTGEEDEIASRQGHLHAGEGRERG